MLVSVKVRLSGAAVCIAALSGFAPPAAGQEVRLTESMAEARLVLNGREIVIGRTPNPEAVLRGEFTKTSRACPPFCIQPMTPVPDVAPAGELELIGFLQDHAAQGTGVLIDARLPEWFGKGAIPGAVNVPFATLDPSNPFRDQILAALGARPLAGGGFDFSQAMTLMVYCNGPWSDQSVRALQALAAAGYPPEKMMHYRGGMQDWLILGLTVAGGPEAEAKLATAEGQP
ncbi:rhodanese-like domain-containing protein [Gemmobacter denitrificans]|uniref:Rhodanese-like domain-containing protein n=1 Tax=Gemmobacter denitrificans TaxID=3123040 RepID=A0ABU8BZ61_9RHOB